MQSLSRFCAAVLSGLYCVCAFSAAASQQPDAPPPESTPTFRTGTNLVLVPALVRTKSGEIVFTLKADDFTLTDDGAPQKLSLEQDTDGEPLALVVAIQVGGAGAHRLDNYRGIARSIEAAIGNVPHIVELVAFDSAPQVTTPFTQDLNAIAEGLRDLDSGDNGAAILDGLQFSVAQLQRQPARYRKAIFLISETIDHGSRLQMEDAVRAVSDTNTAIYSFAFSSSKAEAAHEASQFSDPEHPGPPGGCMAKDPKEDPADRKGKGEKLYDCLSLLAPPLRAAKIAALVAANSLRHNAPETVAGLTGGEYYSFKDARSLEKDMLVVSNHVPNRYVLSFYPQAPHPGLHALDLKLKDYKDVHLTARKNYWAAGTTTGDAASTMH